MRTLQALAVYFALMALVMLVLMKAMAEALERLSTSTTNEVSETRRAWLIRRWNRLLGKPVPKLRKQPPQ